MRRLRHPRPADYQAAMLKRIENGTYRLGRSATNAQIRESIEDLTKTIADPACEPDVREWKKADIRGLRKVLWERGVL